MRKRLPAPRCGAVRIACEAHHLGAGGLRQHVPIAEHAALQRHASGRRQKVLGRLVGMPVYQPVAGVRLQPLRGQACVHVGVAFHAECVFALTALLAQLAGDMQTLLQRLA